MIPKFVLSKEDDDNSDNAPPFRNVLRSFCALVQSIQGSRSSSLRRLIISVGSIERQFSKEGPTGVRSHKDVKI